MEIQTFPGYGYECNSYLIKDDDWILVDIGTDQRAEEIYRNLLNESGFDGLSSIVLTHTHFDHAGGCSRMSELTGANVFVHPFEGERVSSGDRTVTLDSLFGGYTKPFEWSSLEEGKRISSGSAEFEIIYLPGHSAGSIGLWNEDERSLLVGDTVFAEGGIGRFDLPTGDFEQLRSSIERIAAMNVRNLFPGHGGIVMGKGADHITMSLEIVRSGIR